MCKHNEIKFGIFPIAMGLFEILNSLLLVSLKKKDET